MRIFQYIFKRLTYMIPVLLGVTVLVFIISHAISGDPAKMIASPKANRQAVENIRKDHGLDRPLPVQYLIDSLLERRPDKFFNAASHIILPAFCLSYVYLAIVTRIVRSSMSEVLGQDFITTARVNGLSEAIIVLKHAFKNSLIPTVTIIGLSVGELLGGTILTETIFGWPGMGKYVVDSVNYLDKKVVYEAPAEHRESVCRIHQLPWDIQRPGPCQPVYFSGGNPWAGRRERLRKVCDGPHHSQAHSRAAWKNYKRGDLL
jgi:ABC-type dipeptide/oligopeptide/nickel transport system permease component